MVDFKSELVESIAKHTSLEKEKIAEAIEVPKDQKLGDLAFPCFLLSRDLKKNPVDIAKELCEKVESSAFEKITAAGPYINAFINKKEYIASVLSSIKEKKADFGKQKKQEKKAVIEFPSPNTNKPLHLGHVRNMVMGCALNQIIAYNGLTVDPVNLNNDRGVHICKSMLAFQKWGEPNDDSPEKSNLKSDFFVGKYYVLFNQKVKEDPSLEEKAQQMLLKWEEGDTEVIALWEKMNTWAFDGFKETFKRFNVSFSKEYYESQIYKEGKQIILEGLEKGIFEKDENGAIICDLEDVKLGKKVLLRSDGTAVYITQDLALAQKKYEDFKYDSSIYVVATEQNYHFKVLFELMKRLGFPYAEGCYHFAYGMVHLTTGRMKSREGTVIDADTLLDDMKALAIEEIKERYKELPQEEIETRAEIIARAAIKFYMIKNDPTKDITFDPKESLSFEGETGPYLQYTYARIKSILRKSALDIEKETIDYSLLTEDQEFYLVKRLQEFKELIPKIMKRYKISLLSRYLLDLSQDFNSYYHAVKTIQEDKALEASRLALISSVAEIIKQGLKLLGIETIEEM